MSSHRVIEERSLLLHGAVADKLRRDPGILPKARERVERWLVEGPTHRRYAEKWHELLASTPEEVARRLVEPSERMTALRQCSPFAGALTPQERWAILRRHREASQS